MRGFRARILAHGEKQRIEAGIVKSLPEVSTAFGQRKITQFFTQLVAPHFVTSGATHGSHWENSRDEAPSAIVRKM